MSFDPNAVYGLDVDEGGESAITPPPAGNASGVMTEAEFQQKVLAPLAGPSQALRDLAKQIPPVPQWLLDRLADAWREFNIDRAYRSLYPLPVALANQAIRQIHGWETDLPNGEGKLPVVDLGGRFQFVLEEIFE